MQVFVTPAAGFADGEIQCQQQYHPAGVLFDSVLAVNATGGNLIPEFPPPQRQQQGGSSKEQNW